MNVGRGCRLRKPSLEYAAVSGYLKAARVLRDYGDWMSELA